MPPTVFEVALGVPPGFPVLITNQADWWEPFVAPILGLAASLIVAAAAYAGVLQTNRRTDRRELAKWRTETLEEWCSEVCVATIGVQSSYGRAHLAKSEEVIRSHTDNGRSAIDAIMALSYRFMFFGSNELFDAAQIIYDAAEAMDDAVKMRRASSEAEDADAVEDPNADEMDLASQDFKRALLRLGFGQAYFIDVAQKTLDAVGGKQGRPLPVNEDYAAWLKNITPEELDKILAADGQSDEEATPANPHEAK